MTERRRPPFAVLHEWAQKQYIEEFSYIDEGAANGRFKATIRFKCDALGIPLLLVNGFGSAKRLAKMEAAEKAGDIIISKRLEMQGFNAPANVATRVPGWPERKQS
jgi:hypothetical protein